MNTKLIDRCSTFIEDERRFYLHEAGFTDRERELFILRTYKSKTLWEATEIMGYSSRTIDRINKSMKIKIMKASPMYYLGVSSNYK